MPYQTISLVQRGAIAYLELQRPEQENRIDGHLLRDLAAACEALADDPQVRVVVLGGGEGAAFSAGWDASLLPTVWRSLTAPVGLATMLTP